MFAKTETRLSASVTSEDDWQTDVPNIRLSRAFVMVLLMHLVVGGALIAFTLMNPSEANAQGAKPAAAPKGSEKVASSPAAAEKPKEVASNDAETAGSPQPLATDEMRRHIVHSGDSVSKIARQYGVTAEAIHRVNRIDELYQLYQGRVLRIPVSVSTPIEPKSVVADVPSTNGSNPVSSAPSRLPATIPRATLPAALDISANADHEPIDLSLMLPEEGETSRPVVVEEPAAPVVVEKAPAPSRPEKTEAPSAPVVAERAQAVGASPASIVRPREEPQAPRPAEPSAAPEQKTYAVQKGDNAFRIGQRFGIHYKELLAHNGITDASKLQIGQVLRIPN